jgi:hypothetical protein
LHCESLISLLDIHLIAKRCGHIDYHIGTGHPTHHSLHRSKTGLETEMFAQAMTFLDRAAMAFVVVLAATPILAIAASGALV